MAKTRAPALRNYIQFQSNTTTFSEQFNEPVAGYTTYENAWASFQIDTGMNLQVQQAHTLAPYKLYKVRCRYFDGLSASDRIQLGSRTFSINSIDNPNGTNQWWIITATEILR